MVSLAVEWSLDASHPIDGCINITAFVLQSGQWYQKTLIRCSKVSCHRQVTSAYGTLQENDLQQNGAIHNCPEHIVVVQFSAEYQAFLQFQSVNLLFSKIPECSKEYIEVNTFEEQHWIRNKFCGYLDYRKLARLHFTSQAEAIVIRIKLLKGSTFKAVHYVLDRRKGCNETVASSRGVITSPNFPGQYFPRVDCYVHLSLRPDQRAIFRLRQMQLQKYADGSCGPDYLEIVPTSPPSKEAKRKFCGDLQLYNQQYATFFTSGDVVVHFHSDWQEQNNGFLLEYAISTSCGKDFLHTANGTVFTVQPRRDSFGVSDSVTWDDCFTTIHVPYGHVIELWVISQPAPSQEPFGNVVQFKMADSRMHDNDATLNNESANCGDGFVELIEHDATWILCDLTLARNASHVSRSNTLIVRLMRDRYQYLAISSIWYRAKPVNHSQTECVYGWVAGNEYCYLLVEKAVAWEEAEGFCRKQGGHLASVKDVTVQLLLDAIIKYSLLHDDEQTVWIGGNDRMFENYFEWADGRPMSYTNWFPGWSRYNYYNMQPSDDGLSDQDCIELRHKYAFPAKGYGTTNTFFWNDRDCSVANAFICEKLKDGVVPKQYPASCNRTVILAMTHPEEVVTSPAYPDLYPGNMDCSITVVATSGYNVVVTFTHFVLEEGSVCQYDYIEIFGIANERKRHCGDWTNRLKLLHSKSVANELIIKFVSDFSHSYAGFIATVHMEKEHKFCDDDWLQLNNNHCYLFVTYPTVTWQTAQQICSEKEANLVSVGSQDEELFLEKEITRRDSYNSRLPYWLGGKQGQEASETWIWNDASPFIFSAFPKNWNKNGRAIIDSSTGELSHGELCLVLRWQQMEELDSELPSSSYFYWFGGKCDTSARYICKKVSPFSSNVTIHGTGGNISSPNFPAPYLDNLNYTVTLVGPPKSKLIIQFLYLDLESQDDCLYDYVAIQLSETGHVIRLCGPDSTKDKRTEYVSDSNELHVSFHTDYLDNHGGFYAIWTAVDISLCPQTLMNDTSGELTSINFPSFYLNNLDCVTTVQPKKFEQEVERWIWISFDKFDVGHGNGGDLLQRKICLDDFVELTFGIGKSRQTHSTLKLCGNLTDNMQHLGFLTKDTEIKISFHSDSKERFPGFRAKYQTLRSPEITHVVHLNANSSGIFYELNYPMMTPPKANYTRKLIVPIGYNVNLAVKGFRAERKSKRSVNNMDACSKWSMEIYDPYVQTETSRFSGRSIFCKARNDSEVAEFLIKSYLNVLYLRELINGSTESVGYYKMVHTIVKDPEFNKKTLTIPNRKVESCDPNPCQNQGLCTSENICQCGKQYIGMFCELTKCDQKPCVNGTCSLTAEGYVCSCYRSYMGTNCDIKINPCASNPCGNRGICAVEKDNFVCKCQIWWQGPQCETKAFKFTYRPLSQRMLEEPFWLGLITVFVVLAVLGCVWCIKRKFADKLEKFISEEIERNKSQSACKANKRHSLRDPGSPLSLSPQSCPRSLLSRIGLRKHSMLSLESSGSSNYHENRSFSFDDIIKKSDSQRRLDKRCSSPAMQLDKKELLHSLVAPAPTGVQRRRMSLDEFIQMSEKRILERNNSTSQENNIDCTSISEETSFDSSPVRTNPSTAARRKRVNFHRTLEKIDSVSFENERDDELKADMLLALSTNSGIFLRPDSSDFSDGEISSCSSTHAFPSEDQAPNGLEITTEDDAQRLQTITDMSDCSSYELDSSWTSSEHLNAVQAEVRVEVHDVPKVPLTLNCTQNQEVPLTLNCTQNQKEEDKTDGCIGGSVVPLPMIAVITPESPAIAQQLCTMDGCCPNNAQKNSNIPQALKDVSRNTDINCTRNPSFKPISQPAINNTCLVPLSPNLKVIPVRKPLIKQETIPFGPESFTSPMHKTYNGDSFPIMFPTRESMEGQPKIEMATYNVTTQSRMTKLRPAPIRITNLPTNPVAKDVEKQDSQSFPAAPIITITSNVSSCESDTDSPTKTTSRMQYLSPFDIIHQNGEWSTSLSNLSSSGYSSMASPGPSRCNSNSPLFDDTSPGLRPSPTYNHRKYGAHLSPTNLPVRPVSPKHGPKGITAPKTGHLGAANSSLKQKIQAVVRPPLLRTVSVMQKQSDSETTDEQPEAASLPEDSNDDEGIGMDHIDFKIHRGEVTSAKDLELYMDQGKGEPGNTGECNGGDTFSNELVSPAQEVSCPAIVIQTLLQNDSDRDRCWKFVRRKSFQRKLSPVSSRSESPMSDRGCASNSGANVSPSASEKFSSLCFGSNKRSDENLYTDDSDEIYDEANSGVVLNSLTNDMNSSPPSALTPDRIQGRNQGRRREKFPGSKASKSSTVKPRPNMLSLADGVPKDDRIGKRSPKRRLRVQNSLDADASSDSSSITDSPKKPILLTKENTQNKGAYRKRLPLPRCESFPITAQPTYANRADEPQNLSKTHLVNGHPPCTHSLSSPSAETVAVDNFLPDTLHHTSRSCSPYLNHVVELTPNSVSRAFQAKTKSSRSYVAESTANSMTTNDRNLEEVSSQSDMDIWDKDGPSYDLCNSVLTDDSGSEVSFYLGKSADGASKSAETKSLLSPARVSPDMSVICYSAVGFGRSLSEEDDLGFV